MMKLFNHLASVGGVIRDEDSVVYLLASLLDSFSKVDTAFKAIEEVSKWRLLLKGSSLWRESRRKIILISV